MSGEAKPADFVFQTVISQLDRPPHRPGLIVGSGPRAYYWTKMGETPEGQPLYQLVGVSFFDNGSRAAKSETAIDHIIGQMRGFCNMVYEHAEGDAAQVRDIIADEKKFYGVH
jgi:hypothetical protein